MKKGVKVYYYFVILFKKVYYFVILFTPFNISNADYFKL